MSLQEPDEMSREELVQAVEQLQDDQAEMRRELALIRQCLHSIADEEPGELSELRDVLEQQFDEETGTTTNREQMLPAHRMWLDVAAGDGDTIGDSQRRAARLFGQFHDRVRKNESNEVDPSGQKYTLSSGKAREVLRDADEFEGVKDASQSTITARIMRDVQRLTKLEDCDCEEIDECNHGLVEFRPGRPHALATNKKRFQVALQNAYGEDGVSTADDASEQDVEADTDEIEDDLDRLNTTNTEAER